MFPEAAGDSVVPSTAPVSRFEEEGERLRQEGFAAPQIVCAYQHLEKMLLICCLFSETLEKEKCLPYPSVTQATKYKAIISLDQDSVGFPGSMRSS